MRKITSLLLLLLCAVTVLSARENKYDRGIVMKTFYPERAMDGGSDVLLLGTCG